MLPQSPYGDSSLPEGAQGGRRGSSSTCSDLLKGARKSSLREGAGSRLRLTEGERGSDIEVKLHECGLHHRHTHMFVSDPTQRYGLYVDWMPGEADAI